MVGQKYIPYEEVEKFLKWQFDDDFADQQLNLFTIKSEEEVLNDYKRNR